MNDSKKTVPDDPFDDGFVGSGRPLNVFPAPISEEDVRRLEEAWNDPTFYELSRDDIGITAGFVPKQTVDPNRTLLPSREELNGLPPWARVAFAARCARRVLPIVKHLWVNATADHLRALANAVCFAENASATYKANGTFAASTAGVAASQAAQLVARAARAADDAVTAAAAAVESAVNAARGTRDARHAPTEAINALTRVITVRAICHLAGPARDFERLSQLAKEEKWTDDTPVPPSVFGPMWEGPPPEWWTDDILVGLPPESATETNTSIDGHPAPTKDAVAPQ